MGKTNKNVPEQAQSSDSTDSRGMGREDRASEAFRAACEARYVLAKPLAERRKYLDGVGEKRGAAARAYLEEIIYQEWKKKATPKSG